MTPDPSAATGQAQATTGPAAATQPQSHWGQIKDTAAALPPGATMGDAYRAGKGLGQSWANQSAQTHWGAVQDASTHGTFTNGDSGSELATSEDIAGLHSKLDEMHQAIGGMQSSGVGQQGNGNLQGLTPSRMPPRPPQVSPLAASAAQRDAAHASMAAGQQQLQAGQARTLATFQQRQSQGGMTATQPTGNAMGQTTQAASMSGLLGRQAGGGVSSNGQSESTFANTRFGQ